MHPKARRAHCVLLGYPLMDEWFVYLRMTNESDATRSDAEMMFQRGQDLMGTREGKLAVERSMQLFGTASKLTRQAGNLWRGAMRAYYGDTYGYQWVDNGCRVEDITYTYDLKEPS